MRKIVIHRAGGYGQLKLEEHPDPEPQAGEVRVAVEAAGVNFADVVVRQGLYESAKIYVGWPITPGFEIAGRVSATGAGVTDLEPEAEVFAVTRFGGYSSSVCVPRNQVFLRPAQLTAAQAAAFPAVFMTAYHALFQSFVLRSGAKVLVHSAAGGVGTALLQLLGIAGCESVGVVGRSDKVSVAERFGAHHVIDKSREDLWPAARRLAPAGYDVVLDGNGPATLRQSFEHLAPVGKLVTYGFHSMFSKRGGFPNYLKLGLEYLKIPRFHPFDMLNSNRSVIAFNVSFLFERTDLLAEGVAQLLAWLEEERIHAPKVATFSIEGVADAHRAIESGTTTGKLVLTF